MPDLETVESHVGVREIEAVVGGVEAADLGYPPLVRADADQRNAVDVVTDIDVRAPEPWLP